MNVEIYSYSILATVLGMLVVFGFLSFLSFLMAFLKAIFETKKQRVVEEEKKASGPDWLWAAVSVYLALEEEEFYASSAKPWQAKTENQGNPWLTGGKFSRQGLGV